MNNYIKINKVAYYSENYKFESPIFEDGINIITGNNGDGKTTFMNFVHFALGGTVDSFREKSENKDRIISKEKDGYVELSISLNGNQYILKRATNGKNSGMINVLNQEGQSSNYFVDRRANNSIFSDWILKELRIPPFKIYQGIKESMINFMDIYRLIYHDQLSDRNYVYSTPDGKTNFINDSALMRKIIFELLTSNSSLELYEMIFNIKELETKINISKRSIDLIKTSASKILNTGNLNNTKFLQNEIEAIDRKIYFIEKRLNSLEDVPVETDNIIELKNLYKNLKELSSQKFNLDKEMLSLNKDLSNYLSLKKFQENEIQLIESMIYTQEKLNLVNPDSCPICGNDISDKNLENHCLCGKELNKLKYEDFFYTKNDHEEILYSKSKGLRTTEKVIETANNSLGKLESNFKILLDEIIKIRNKISQLVTSSKLPNNISIAKSQIDELKELNIKKNTLLKEYELSKEAEKEIERLYNLEDKLEEERIKFEELDLSNRKMMSEIIKSFSKIYSDYLTSFDPIIQKAKINDDYVPILNDYEYLNAAIKSPKRFFYYLTLLKLSLEKNIPFPKLILIDTPQNFGLDPENTLKMIDTLYEYVNKNKHFQIFITIKKDYVPKRLHKNISLELKGLILENNNIYDYD